MATDTVNFYSLYRAIHKSLLGPGVLYPSPLLPLQPFVSLAPPNKKEALLLFFAPVVA
jgi:hypothetical protein